jgi:hypothetical protein
MAWRTFDLERTYKPQELRWELGLGKTQFTSWVKALGLSPDGSRKHVYTERERTDLLRFRSLVKQHKLLDVAFAEWEKSA